MAYYFNKFSNTITFVHQYYIVMSERPLNILCISRFFKGENFIIGAKEDGNHVYLLTSKKLESKPWPWSHLDDVFYMETDALNNWNLKHLLDGLSYKMRTLKFDILVALDDFDVEHVAVLREYFRIPGMGDSTARYFRDKLAMRMKAQEEGIAVPAFTSLFHDADIHQFTQAVPAPWLVKPRMQASAAGIKKIYNTDELWRHLEYLGSERHEYLLEKFAPGDVYHVDALTSAGRIVFAKTSQYLDTPFEVAHGGGIFRSITVESGSEDDKALQEINVRVMNAFGMQYSASHTEFIKSKEDGLFYFLETASRVGGAHLADMVEFASGINLWKEWAHVEAAQGRGQKYKLPKVKKNYAGIIVSLSKYEHPDMSVFTDKEIVWKINKKHHVGLIFESPDRNKILALLDKYAYIIKKDFHASAPAKEKLIDE